MRKPLRFHFVDLALTGYFAMSMLEGRGLELERQFRAESNCYTMTTAVRKNQLAVSHIRRHTSGHGLSALMPARKMFSVVLQFRDQSNRELFLNGKSVDRRGYGARTISIVDHEQQPQALMHDPFDMMMFDIPRATLDDIAYDLGAKPVERLDCERGTFDETVWHLGSALLPALARPQELGAMYAEQIMLATHTYFAVTFGGMRPPSRPSRGSLAPWQLHRVQELMLANLGGDPSLSMLALECGLSLSHFKRAFRESAGCPPYTWLQRQRVEHAKQLLRANAIGIADIAIECGFADQSHFTRVFTAIVGIPPRAWQRAVQA